MIGAFVASTVVALVQYARTRDRRLLPLTAVFLVPALALSRGWWEGWGDFFLGTICLVGLVFVVVLPASVSAHRPSGGSARTPSARGPRIARS